MRQPATKLTDAQRDIVDQTIRDHCRIRSWTLHGINVLSNHVHVVVSADRKPDEIMNQLKAWCSRRLSDAAGLESPVAKGAGRKRWFTEGGNAQAIENDEYFHAAVKYVLEGQ
jgi:REP element-mobilizing transposase RayT